MAFSPTATKTKFLISSDNLKQKNINSKKLSDLNIKSCKNDDINDENFFATNKNVSRRVSILGNKQESLQKSNNQISSNLDDSVHKFASDLDKSPKKVSFIDKYSPKKGKRKEFF